MSKHVVNLQPALQATVDRLIHSFQEIGAPRKAVLEQLANFVEQRVEGNSNAVLNFICTHNSRRSIISQVWGQVAAYNYNVQPVRCISGGTEATRVSPAAIKALQSAGFGINLSASGTNPVIEISYASGAPAIQAFSKTYDDAINEAVEFAAIMTCADADEKCPYIPGALVRIPLRYDDPKKADGTPQEHEAYLKTVMQVGRELLYAFSLIKLSRMTESSVSN